MRRLWTGRSPRPTKSAVGVREEARALAFLKQNGLRLVQRNFRCRYGEIDLILQDGDCLIVVEVRSRVSADFETPALTVDDAKQQKIARAALAFLAQTRRYSEWPVRFDVVAILHAEKGPGTIQWIKDAFRV